MTPKFPFLAISVISLILGVAKPTGAEARSAESNIRVDNSPLPPDTKARTSFSAVAKKVGPSVVNVYSTRAVRGQSSIFNEPFLRRFFGGGGDGEGAVPRPRTEQGLGSGVIVTDDGY